MGGNALGAMGGKEFFCLLSINSVRNKVTDLGEILKDVPLDNLVITETKLDESFPDAHFKLNGYEVRSRRDRHKHEGGLLNSVKNEKLVTNIFLQIMLNKVLK